MEIINRKVSELIPYERNPRKNDEAVKYVKASIEQFGFKVPIVIDAQGVIVAGHTRLKAAKELGMKEVPCIVADDLTPEQVKAFRLADNQVSSVATYDENLLREELLELENYFDMSDFAFEINAPTGVNPNEYTSKANIPQYEITGEQPSESELIDCRKADGLIAEIEGAQVPDDVRAFLVKAATRHYVFDYKKIAEYYANAEKSVQELMERSALVIIDYENAIANGYARVSGDIEDMLEEDGA
jgi:hypothetical protein